MKEAEKALASNPDALAALREELRGLQSTVAGVLENLRGRGGRDVAEQPKTPPIAPRIRETYRSAEASTARPTDDQLRITDETGNRLKEETATLGGLVNTSIPAFNRKLDEAGVRWTPGRSPVAPATTQ